MKRLYQVAASVAAYMSQRIYGPASGILVILSLLVGLLGTIGTYLSLRPQAPELSLWIVAVAAVYPLVLTVWVIYREVDLARRRRYAPALRELKGCFREFQHLSRLLHSIEEQSEITDDELEVFKYSFSTGLQEILSAFARCFGLITGLPCRACIKVIPAEDLETTDMRLEDIVVVTLARDKESQEQNAGTDLLRYESRADKIVLNSDFETLYSPSVRDQGFYLCNNIPRLHSRGKYKNSSITVGRTERLASSLHDEDTYVLPYRSSLTWPIRHVPGPIGRSIFVGFLSIDAPSRHMFDHRWDPALGSMLATALFEPILRFTEILNSIERNSTAPSTSA